MPHLQPRDLPPAVHEALRVRARREGISMREYVLRLIEADLGRQDSWQQMLDELAAAPIAAGAPSGAELVRQARREREDRATGVR